MHTQRRDERHFSFWCRISTCFRFHLASSLESLRLVFFGDSMEILSVARRRRFSISFAFTGDDRCSNSVALQPNREHLVALVRWFDANSKLDFRVHSRETQAVNHFYSLSLCTTHTRARRPPHCERVYMCMVALYIRAHTLLPLLLGVAPCARKYAK